MNTPILECRDLSKQFPGPVRLLRRTQHITAVDRVSLSVQPGETLAIVGESGSGKSTLGRLLLRLLTASAGQVFYQGEEITRAGGDRLNQLRRELQIIFQDPFASLNPRMTVESLVGEPLWLHTAMARTERRDRVHDLLRTVGLPDAWAQRYPHEFSGGQRQRIGIARALASSPKLLLGDEPVSALDVSVQAQVVNLLEDLKARFGLTMIIVAHGLAVIRHMSDRVAVMYLGQIIELARADELFDAPLHPYTQALIASAPQLQPGLRQSMPVLQGDLPNPAVPPSGCRFHTRCPYVRDECRQLEPIRQVLPGGRQVACHRWQEIHADRSVITVAPPSEAFLRRRALFEQAARHTS
ncbi:ABC transporter ATP-binding protein [Musicola paradisiaca]|uniref:Oligopeptide/dipeptide ABC transporter, ATPase subunit n=1 Tax=Musicola paradisiaca (strain Ech703) TaxID=579405 RepID=C6C9Y2_MUSP7|nr:oligopeptide/dipeptide ABC transporter ATP-binding protein [Musicola paradisiaca]ACS86404.1 oligopeptide/dipeptide ABC transporter, ATPase subunit [Musicola paradisiaca Ech703]